MSKGIIGRKRHLVIHRATRFGLPVWLAVSLLLWTTLSDARLLMITPPVCGVLLALVGVVIISACQPIIHHRDEKPHEWRATLAAALIAPPIALIFAVRIDAILTEYPSPDIAALLWGLCSLGLVLTMLVSRLIGALFYLETMGPSDRR